MKAPRSFCSSAASDEPRTQWSKRHPRHLHIRVTSRSFYSQPCNRVKPWDAPCHGWKLIGTLWQPPDELCKWYSPTMPELKQVCCQGSFHDWSGGQWTQTAPWQWEHPCLHACLLPHENWSCRFSPDFTASPLHLHPPTRQPPCRHLHQGPKSPRASPLVTVLTGVPVWRFMLLRC